MKFGLSDGLGGGDFVQVVIGSTNTRSSNFFSFLAVVCMIQSDHY